MALFGKKDPKLSKLFPPEVDRELSVSGVSFNQSSLGGMKGKAEFRLVRERDNPYDSNAVGVWLRGSKSFKVGHIPADEAKLVAAWVEHMESTGNAVWVHGEVHPGDVVKKYVTLSMPSEERIRDWLEGWGVGIPS